MNALSTESKKLKNNKTIKKLNILIFIHKHYLGVN